MQTLLINLLTGNETTWKNFLKEEDMSHLTPTSDAKNNAQQTSKSEKVFFSFGLKDTDRYRECQQLSAFNVNVVT